MPLDNYQKRWGIINSYPQIINNMEKTLDTKYTYTEKKDTRSGFGDGLLEAGRRNENVVALCADLIGSLKMGDFQKEFPDRFF